ncbi:uncharacterized protein PAE49_004495 isoform 2-T2 [Odontesthes bonariensis]|uniref:uncharacterized protein LOC142378294 isoform X2 n=1 Tax=Odontesthes bonariensis TaxID=219752 RepID=UPI003F5897FC
MSLSYYWAVQTPVFHQREHSGDRLEELVRKGNMASSGTSTIFIFLMFIGKSAQSFVEVHCESTNVGQYQHQSTLSCVVKPSQHQTSDFEITAVIWKKAGVADPLLYFDLRDLKKAPGYSFAVDSWDKKNRNVSLLIADTKVADEGEYTCTVVTDIGDNKQTTSLKVSAKYSTPTVEHVAEKNNNALICKSHSGYPEGSLHWVDEHQGDWTKSSTLEVVKMENGLIELISRLPLLPGSTLPSYTCILYNSSSVKVDETTFLMSSPEGLDDQHPKNLTLTSKVIAPVVVIGSLIVGLLLLLVFRIRRSRQARRPSTTPLMGQHEAVQTRDMDVEEGDSGEANEKC